MKKIGIIVEYNPFHNGHLHHLEEVKKRMDSEDVLIAVMSGNFVMRGEVSTLDKWKKTEIALNHGIDLVVELPFIFAVQSADYFARKAVEILHVLGVDELYFGSESNHLAQLYKFIDVLDSEEYNSRVKQFMKMGFSYPKSCALALDDLELPQLKSNDALGLQYLKAIRDLGSHMTPHTILRVHSDYLDNAPKHPTIASATAIRQLDSIDAYVPNDVVMAKSELGFHTLSDYAELISYQITTLGKKGLKDIFMVDEGIETALYKTKDYGFDDRIQALVSKRYTKSRIQRMLCYVLLPGKSDVIKALLEQPVDYVRVLGFSTRGQAFLNATKKSVTYVTRNKDGLHPILDIEIQAAMLYALKAQTDTAKREYGSPVRRQNEEKSASE